MKAKKSILLFILTAALALTCGACALRPKPARTDDGKALFRLGFAGTPSTLNPYASDSPEAACVLGLLYDTLFAVDMETGEYAGSLCEDYSVSDTTDGGKLWKLTLRSDVYWNDGKPLTARDVEFSLQSARDFSTLYAYPDCEFIHTTGIAVEDDSHLSFVVWEESNAVTECLSHVPILPRHIWNQPESMSYATAGFPQNPSKARAELFAMPANADTMIGSGLFVWGGIRNNICTLYRNNAYWNGSSAVEVLELRFGLEDPAAELAAGNIDACYTMPGASYKSLSKTRGLSLASGTTGEMYLLGFNLHENGKALLRDRTVRQAIELCMDKQGIMDAAFGGGAARFSVLSPDGDFSGEDSGRTFDPAAAAELLTRSGYADTDGDGVRENTEGDALRFSILCSSDSAAWERAAGMLKGACADAGIELSVSATPSDTLFERVAERDYDMYLSAWQTYRDPFFSFSLFRWDGGNNAYSVTNANGETVFPGWNDSGYDNAEYDALYEQMAGEKDPEVRQEIVEKMDTILRNDVPAAVLGFAERSQACSPVWLGLVPFRNEGLFFTPFTIRQQLQYMYIAGQHKE